MAKLIYVINTSLDGYIEDAAGNFDWTEPDDELHLFFNDLLRPVGTHLLGRRMYETMAVWETDPSIWEGSDVTRDFAELWQAADKVVYSTTLDAAPTRRTRIERSFDPAAVRELKAAATADLAVAGPTLARHAFEASLVDECHLVVNPVAVGGGKPALPTASASTSSSSTNTASATASCLSATESRSVPLMGTEREFEELVSRLDPPMIVVTTVSGDQRAGCLAGFHTQCSVDPPRYAIWLSKANHTMALGLYARRR